MLAREAGRSVRVRLVMGLFSFLPLAALIVMALIPAARQAGGVGVGPAGPAPVFPWQIFIALMTLLLLFFHVHFLYTNERVGRFGRIAWTVLLLLGNVLALPAHWYLYMWRRPPRPLSGHARRISETEEEEEGKPSWAR